MKRAQLWLKPDKNEHTRYAGILVIKELAINAPAMLYQHVEYVLQHRIYRALPQF